MAAGMGAMMAVYAIVILVLWVLQVVAYWKIFEKAGEQGWKSIIPVYSDYILYRIAWDTKPFWVLLGLAALNLLLSWIPVAGVVFSFITGILAVIIEILLYVKLSRAFGHGSGFAAGLVFLSTIFVLILGFDSSEYLGPQE
ncbi:MAG: hypothetical protein J6A56_05910 [Clostridia bacterium]|nr:hypothetical protein [Clostridia bacterium]